MFGTNKPHRKTTNGWSLSRMPQYSRNKISAPQKITLKSRVPIEMEKLSQAAILGLFFSSPFSRSLFSISAAFLVVTFLFSGGWVRKSQKLLQNKPALFLIFFTVWIFISIFWSLADWESISNSLKINWKLFLIPIVVVYLDNSKIREYCLSAFALGCCLLLAFIYFILIFGSKNEPPLLPESVFFNPIPQSVALSVFCAWCLYSLLFLKKNINERVLFGVLFVLASYPVLFVSQQRLGYLAWGAALMGILIIFSDRRLRVKVLLAIFLIIFAIFYLDQTISYRFALGYKELTSFNFENSYSSIGARLQMWNISIRAIAESPIWGHGIGSYPSIAQASFSDDLMCQIGCGHPHNQFLFYWVEFGFLGLLLFLTALYFTFKANISNIQKNALTLVILMIFLFCSLVDSTLWYRGFFYLFAPMLGLVFSAPRAGGAP